MSPSRDIFLVEFSSLERSVFFINHIDSHGFLIRFISPDLNYGPAQDLPRYGFADFIDNIISFCV